MGGCPEGEKPEETAIRELQEETGLIAKSVREIKKIHTSNSVTDEFGIVYIAEDLEMGKTAPEETEDIITVKLPLKEAVQMAFDSKITDSISVAGLLKIGILKQILPNCD
jgi:8-oxo-dGTP pyrophosphatase MutT (NUDIX family)